MGRFLAKIMPFFVLGLMIVIFVVGFVLLSYLLIFGALIGFVLFTIAWLREKLFPTKRITVTKPKEGRIIDHDDIT